MTSLCRFALMVCGAWLALPAVQAQSFELHPKDHISIVGNTLAERMQHMGWLETYLQSRFPKHELVVRNLGFSGDEVDPAKRLRSQDFGSPDQHLARNKTDVIFAFFGYNESFADEAGLDKFKDDLDKYLRNLKSQRYNGKSAPRIVIFSPIAFENLKTPHLPDGREHNRRLALYTAAMQSVAQARQVTFVDLFRPTLDLYAKSENPLTINGVHLNELGDQRIGQAIDEILFGPRATAVPSAQLESLRQAVNDKNFCWFEKYRTTDGYSIFGGRADLKFTNGQTNREVAQREMEVLEVMTSNRDKRVWAVAQGNDLKIDDSNAPPFIPVITNKRGEGPRGEHIYLSGIEAIDKMTLGKNLKINLFASEEKWPFLAKPVQMSFDAQGRLWVAVWPSYPHWKPGEELNDKLIILEDTDGDGAADKCTVFADHLSNPTGFAFANGGVLVAQVPDLLFLKDNNGDDVADVRERVLHGFDSADTHHSCNSFCLDPGGAVYFQEGTFHHTSVESPYAPTMRNVNAGVYRYEPLTQKIETYVTYGFANPHGHVWDRWGQDFITDGTGAVNYFGAAFSGHLDYPQKHAHVEPYFQQRTRPCPGTEILSSQHFPEDMQGNLLIGNVINVQGILQYKYRDAGSGFTAREVEPIVVSSDPNFRPSSMQVGPDGALYFLDWQNPIIGHMQHNLRDPSRDRTHGRVYRITYSGRPLSQPARIAGQPLEKLLELLKSPEDRVRSRARTELGARDSNQVLAAVGKWAAALDQGDPDFEHHRLEALWAHQSQNAVNEPLLREVLASPDFRARAAAVRVLCYQRDRLKDALELLKKLAADPHPRVRLEAVRAASFFTEPDAVEVALVSSEYPTDYYLTYTRKESLKQLEPYWKGVIEAGQKIHLTTDAGAKFFLKSLKTEQLLSMPKTKAVCGEIVLRPGLRDEQRRDALRELAQLDMKSELRVLLDTLTRLDGKPDDRDEGVLFDLVRQWNGRSAAELAPVRSDLEKLATGAKTPNMRQVAYLALIAVDQSADKAWNLAIQAAPPLVDLLSAVPLISDLEVRTVLYARIEPLLQGKIELKGGERSATIIAAAAMNALASIRGQEARTFKTLATFVVDNQNRLSAIRALQRIPAVYWPQEDAPALMKVALDQLKRTPIAERTNVEALDVMHFAETLAGLLPADQAKQTRSELGELGVRVIKLGTLPERMSYDQEVLILKAGKPVEFMLDNADLMPHNFVIVTPGALQEVGEAAEKFGQQSSAAAANFVPPAKLSQILLSSKILQTRETQRLSFTAPTQPGVYPYVCTYPGHWRRMYGALYVVEDLDACFANPEAYLAAIKLPIKDDLLKDRRPRTAWKFEDLSELVAKSTETRSYTHGKQLFKVAGCVACHKLDGEGNEFGADLLKLDPKLTSVEILKDILEPSFRVNEKYQSVVFQLDNGQVKTGLIIEETPAEFKIVENPLANLQPTIIQKSAVAEQKKSPVSLMPKGLLDKLTRDEVLDLVAFITCRGDKHHELFKGEMQH